MSLPLLIEAPAVPTPEIAKLAFFTVGDDRQVGPPDLRITMEEMWRRRAEDLAPGRVHGVRTVQDATRVIKGLEPNVILDEVFFLGHGSGEDDGFFFFSGRPDPDLDFAADDDDQVLEISRAEMKSLSSGPSKEFLFKMFHRLARSDPRVDFVRINFLACFMGRGETHRAVCDFLSGWLVGLREVRFEGGAYADFYETVFVTDGGGNIVHWEDHIVEQPGGLEVVPNPGPNQIPPFQQHCGGVMVRPPFLFIIPAPLFQPELEGGTVSETLRQEFRLHGRSLSGSATVLGDAADRWRIVDSPKQQVYRVVREGDDLHVFQP